MRRTDREIKNFSKIIEIIDKCDCCRLGFIDGHEAYIVPMNFGYDVVDNHVVFYFHCASSGRKTRLLSPHSIVSFEMDTKHELVTGSFGCNFSFLYQSVMGTGTISTLHDKEEKRFAMGKIMEHYTDETQWEFNKKVLDETTVFKYSVKTLSGKEH